MKKIGIGLLAVFLGLSFFVPSSFALPAVIGDYNALFFENSEVLIDNDADGFVSVGDTFWGVLQLQSIKAPTNNAGQGGSTIWGVGGGIAPPPEITGYFATDVVAVLPPGNSSTTEPTIVLGPAAVDPKGLLNTAAGEAIRIFEDLSLDYNDSTQVSAFNTATDGTHLWSLGFGVGATPGCDPGYWYTEAPVLPPGAGQDVGESYAGLNFISPFDPYPVGLVNDPNENWSSTLLGLPPGGANVEIWFNSELSQLNPITDTVNMHFFSNDPAVYKPVPEPSTLLLLGVGLLGFAACRRKRIIKS